MKSKLILVSFLLLLYIGPMIFISSYASLAILAEPNINKDFSLSTEYEISDESITSFAETLPDDILFYPDSMGNFLAVDGNATDVTGGTYASTQASDDVNWYVEADITGSTYNSTFLLEFNASVIQQTPQIKVNIEYFFNRSSGSGTFDDGGVQLYNYSSSSWNYIYTDTDWHGSEVSRTISANSTGCIDTAGALYLRVTLEITDGGAGTAFGLYIDFCQISYMTLADSAHYAESFADVSDWVIHTGNTITTDGDIGTFTTEGDNAYNIYYCNTPSQSFENYYLEFRYSVNDTDADKFAISLKSEDSYLGDLIYSLAFYHTTTDYETHKVLVTGTGVVESISILIKDDNANAPIAGSIDFLRISPANESGWQHDGSTTAGTIEVGAMSVSTDGDVLHCVGTGSSYSSVDWKIDNTATESDLSQSSYPFIEFRWKAAIGQDMRISLYNETDQSKYSYLTETGDWVITRYNAKAFSSVGSYYSKVRLRDGKDNDQDFYLDYIRFYSIANFTVTQSGATTNDYLYVDSGVLYSNIDDGYIELNHDPALTVNTATYNVWNTTTQTTAPQSAYYVDSWSDYSSETRGPLISGTLTDLKLNFTTTESLSAIKFIDFHDWQEINDVELMFQVNWSPEFQFGYDAFFIFLGLIMIPVSTMYLVKGGRKEMSADKLFYALVIFALGVGFLIGGILP